MNEALVPILGPSEARRLTDEVKRDVEALWGKLLELYDGGAHTALGYSSWGAYFEVEFRQSGRRGYQLLDAGRVLANVPTSESRDTGQRLESVNHGSTAPPNERQARELAPLLEKPEQLRETWAEVRGFHSNPTAADVHEAVERKLAPKSRVLEKDFQKAVTDALNALGWRWHHSRPARTSKGWRTALSGDAGYPDITAVRRDRILFIELKAEKGRLSEEQGVWLADLGAAGAETHCWRPSDWPAIKEALR
jgi:hypothetical protein